MISSIKYYFQLLKFRLSFTVVISATAGYLIGVENFDYIELILLATGGFLVTGSANGFNQILEKDYDKLMLRFIRLFNYALAMWNQILLFVVPMTIMVCWKISDKNTK